MIKLKTGKISIENKIIITELLENFPDAYRDLYITKDRLRYFLKENLDLLYAGLEKGDKIIYDENIGFIYICGYSDKFPRKFIKILSETPENADKLIKVMLWNIGNEELYWKGKINNPLKEVLEKNKFKFKGARGKEILLVRVGIKKDQKEN